MASIWDYPDPTWSEGSDFVGYDVEATDGSIGSIDEASNEAGDGGRLRADRRRYAVVASAATGAGA